MASLRQRFRVSWDGGEPVEVLTTVQDLINAVDRVPEESVTNKIAVNAALIYSALERSATHTVPPYEQWIDLLDNYQEVPSANGAAGPTRSDPSPTEPSLSDASPAPTGEVGSAPEPETSTTTVP